MVIQRSAEKLPLCGIKWERLVPYVRKAEEIIGHFDALLRTVPHPSKTLTLLKIEEAIRSLRLEIPLLEILRDSKQLNSYLLALRDADAYVKKNSISLTLVRKIHARLFAKTKMRKKDIGHFRDRQNWIGPEGCKIEDAYLLPPKASLIETEMKNWQSYIRYKEKNFLVQLAILFAQFLVIHPFMNGNGRVSRTLIPLFLYKKKQILHPLFYMSSFFKRYRTSYFDKLFYISSEKDWTSWIIFFLKGLIQQGKKNCNKVKKIAALYKKTEKLLARSASKKEIRFVLDYIFQHPLFDEKGGRKIGKTRMSLLAKAKILRRVKMKARKPVWICAPLVRLLKN